MPSLQPAVFLDRDGTLMEDVVYCRDPADVRVFPGVVEALRRMKEAGFKNVIITNQSGIRRGMIAQTEYDAVHARLLELLGDGMIDAAYFCPDRSDAPGPRRKPNPGMVFDAARDLGLDLSRSWFIGDKAIDVQCGVNAGTRSILVLTGQGSAEEGDGAAFVANDLEAAAEFILKHSDASR